MEMKPDALPPMSKHLWTFAYLNQPRVSAAESALNTALN